MMKCIAIIYFSYIIFKKVAELDDKSVEEFKTKLLRPLKLFEQVQWACFGLSAIVGLIGLIVVLLPKPTSHQTKTNNKTRVTSDNTAPKECAEENSNFLPK
jgi:hypothetical protein